MGVARHRRAAAPGGTARASGQSPVGQPGDAETSAVRSSARGAAGWSHVHDAPPQKPGAAHATAPAGSRCGGCTPAGAVAKSRLQDQRAHFLDACMAQAVVVERSSYESVCLQSKPTEPEQVVGGLAWLPACRTCDRDEFH